MPRPTIAIMLPLAVVAALLAGCSNSPYPAGQSAQAVIYDSLIDNPRSLDPSVAYDSAYWLVQLIHPTYFRYHFLKHEPFEQELNLGAAMPKREPWPTPASSGERWTFRIKPGLRFQGDACFPAGRSRAITADDFLYSFRRMADPSVPCPVRGFVEDKIVGFREYIAANRRRIDAGGAADYDREVAGLQLDAHDPLVFRIVLTEPYPQLRFLMTMPFTTPQAREAVEYYGKEIARHPVGCGPFVLAEYAPKKRIVLKANPNRGDERYPSDGETGDAEAGLLVAAGARLPLAEQIVYSLIKENTTGWNLFQQGYMDMWGVDQQNYSQVIGRQGRLSDEMRARGVRLQREAGLHIRYFAFNMDDPIFGGYSDEQRRLRQAVSLAIDSQAFIDLFEQGNAIPAEFNIPPGLLGYDATYRNPYRRNDLELARRLLAEAGYPDGIDARSGERLTLYFDNAAVTPGEQQFVGLVKKQIEQIGIRVASRSWRPVVWQDHLFKGEFQFVALNWLADYPDPENLVFMLYSRNKRPGPNYAAYANAEYDRLFERMRALEDGPERAALIRQMRTLAVDDCPWVFLYHTQRLFITYDWLSNVKPHAVAFDTPKYYRIDGPSRAALQAEWNQPRYAPGVFVLALLIVGMLPAVQVVRRRRGRRLRRRS